MGSTPSVNAAATRRDELGQKWISVLKENFVFMPGQITFSHTSLF